MARDARRGRCSWLVRCRHVSSVRAVKMAASGMSEASSPFSSGRMRVSCSFAAGEKSGRERASSARGPSVQGKLAPNRYPVSVSFWDVVLGCEDRDGDRKVVMRPGFPEMPRRRVHGDDAAGKPKPAFLMALRTRSRLLDRSVGQPDDLEARKSGGEVGFDGDAVGVQPTRADVKVVVAIVENVCVGRGPVPSLPLP